MKSKKAAGPVIWIVMTMALLLIFFFVYSGTVFKLYNKLFSGTDEQIESARDADKDNVANFADKCPCQPGDIGNNGCPIGYKITGSNSGEENRDCL